MRALYIENFSYEDNFTIKDEKFHHLKNVVRVKASDEILILDGAGKSFIYKIDDIAKKEISISKVSESSFECADHGITLAIAQVKKDAMDSILKSACELGIRKIYIMKTEFSQSYELNLDRAKKILVSALEQSNNLYLPKLELVSMNEIPYADFDQVYIFATETASSGEVIKGGSKLLVIGPEGGFSKDDLASFSNINNSLYLHLPTPILRSPTAVNCAVGYLLGQSVES